MAGCVSREPFRHVWGRTGCDHDPEMPNGPWNYHRVTREKMMKLAIFSQVSLAAAHAHSSEDTLEAMTASVAITTDRVHPQALALPSAVSYNYITALWLRSMIH